MYQSSQTFDFSSHAASSDNNQDFISSKWTNDGGDLPPNPNPNPQAANCPDFITSPTAKWMDVSFLNWNCNSERSQPAPQRLQIQTQQLLDPPQPHSAIDDLLSGVTSNNETSFFSPSGSPKMTNETNSPSSTTVSDSSAACLSASNEFGSNGLFCSPFSSGAFQPLYTPMSNEIFPSTMNAPIMLPYFNLEQNMMSFVTPLSPASTTLSSNSEPTCSPLPGPSKEHEHVRMKPTENNESALHCLPERPLTASEKKRIREWARNLTCFNCKTSKTPLWRRTPDKKHNLCNACGLYFTKHEAHRPFEYKDKIPRRFADSVLGPRKVCKSTKNAGEILNQIAALNENVKRLMPETDCVAHIINDDSLVTLNWAQLQHLICSSK